MAQRLKSWHVLLLMFPLAACGSLPGPPPEAAPARPQSPASLVIHYVDVGQGDAAVAVTPNGEVVMFDNGQPAGCAKLNAYLREIGATHIDYHVASHYHADHVACAQSVFGSFPLAQAALDRGGSYSSGAFSSYLQAVGALRTVVGPGTDLTLDPDSSTPVHIEIVSADADGMPTTDENSRSLVAVLRFGDFDAEFGGDLTGGGRQGSTDVESAVAPRVGRVEVYKVHHHGSSYSSNARWLATTSPKVAIISVGNGNTYGHPTADCLERLHAAGVKTYWTESGAGVAPGAGDTVAGNVRIEVKPGANTFSVSYGGMIDTYSTWEASSRIGAPGGARSQNDGRGDTTAGNGRAGR